MSSSTSERAPDGTFAPGNPGGPGNPFARNVARLRAALLRSITEENVEQIAQMLLEKSLAGDLAATKLLLLYVLGKPKPVVEPDRVEIDDYHLMQESKVGPNEFARALNGISAPLVRTIADIIEPVKRKQYSQMLDPNNTLTPDEIVNGPIPESPPLTPEEIEANAELSAEIEEILAERRKKPAKKKRTSEPRTSEPRTSEPRANGEVRSQGETAARSANGDADRRTPSGAGDLADGGRTPNGFSGESRPLPARALDALYALYDRFTPCRDE